MEIEGMELIQAFMAGESDERRSEKLCLWVEKEVAEKDADDDDNDDDEEEDGDDDDAVGGVEEGEGEDDWSVENWEN